MNIDSLQDKLLKLRMKRNTAVLQVGAIDNEINDELAVVPRLKVGDVYASSPYQVNDERWSISYCIISEQEDKELSPRHNTNHGVHARVQTLFFNLDERHDHKSVVGFSGRRHKQQEALWLYGDKTPQFPNGRWMPDDDGIEDEGDAVYHIGNVLDYEENKEIWGFNAGDDLHGQQFGKGRITEELYDPHLATRIKECDDNVMHPLEGVISSDEIIRTYHLKVRYEIYCLRTWARNKLESTMVHPPDGWNIHLLQDKILHSVYLYRWYRSLGARYVLTEDGWRDYELDTFCPEEMSSEDLHRWADDLTLIEYDKNN